MSFASYNGASMEFLYNCASDKTALDLSKDVHKQPEVTTNDLSLVPIEGKKWQNQFIIIFRVSNASLVELWIS